MAKFEGGYPGGGCETRAVKGQNLGVRGESTYPGATLDLPCTHDPENLYTLPNSMHPTKTYTVRSLSSSPT